MIPLSELRPGVNYPPTKVSGLANQAMVDYPERFERYVTQEYIGTGGRVS